MIRWNFLLPALGLLMLGSGPSSAHDVKALGATTCGQATCHSAEKPWPNSSVTQREYVRWKENDPHARSFQILQTPKAQRIARDLGYARATSAKLCLDCHSFNIAPDHREDTFNLAEGVTCEACHGPGSAHLNWATGKAPAEPFTGLTEYGLTIDNSAGGEVVLQQCATCHGVNAEGDRLQGAPNLTDKISLYGRDRASLTETITNSRYGVMPRWNNRLDPATIKPATGCGAAWLARLSGGQEVGSSNLPSPTKKALVRGHKPRTGAFTVFEAVALR
mgnify:CR=1 FL=1